jgi:outer membrane protein assembly factor BamA
MTQKPKRGFYKLEKKISFKGYLLTIIFIVLSIQICSLSVFAEDKAEEKKKKDSNLIILPVIFYSPETKLAFGFGGGYFFRSVKENLDLKPSSVNSFVFYTTNKQFQLFVMPDVYLKKNEYRFQGMFGFSKFKDKFYGIGPDTTPEMEEKYISRFYLMNINIQKKVFSYLSAGIRYDFGHQKIVEVEENGLLDSGEISGSEGGNISGLGFILSLDSRDNIFYSRSGGYHQVSATFYRRAIGSDYHFTKYVFDLRTYLSVSKKHTVALQGFLSFSSGDVPFQLLSFIGGPQVMRGYYMGRYRDKNMAVLQMEYRVQLTGRFGIVGFAGVGNVADRSSRLDFTNPKYNLGLGLRYMLNRDEKINLRLDMGFTDEGRGFYISATEAF